MLLGIYDDILLFQLSKLKLQKMRNDNGKTLYLSEINLSMIGMKCCWNIIRYKCLFMIS